MQCPALGFYPNLAQRVLCSRLIREPGADRFGHSTRPKRSRGNRPDAAGKPALSRTDRIGDPFDMCRCGSHTQKKENPSQRLTTERSAHHSPPQLPSKLGQAPQAQADKSGVKSASGPHPQNVRDSASGATSPFWSSTSGPEPISDVMRKGEADDAADPDPALSQLEAGE